MVENKLDFFAITETWLSNNEDDIINALTPNGYSFYHKPRLGKKGGGVGLLIKSNIKINILVSQTFKSFEHAEYILKLQYKVIRLVVVYRPPAVEGCTFNTFHDEFAEYLTQAAAYPESILILGDFNIHLDKPESYETVRFCNLINIHHIVQKVSFPTHSSGHWLDLMLIKEDECCFSNPTIIDNGLSDHVAIASKLYISKPDPVVENRNTRNIKDVDHTELSKDLSSICIDCTDPNIFVEQLNSKLDTIISKHAPITEKKITIRPNTAWYNAALRNAKVIKRRLERKWRKSGKPDDYQLFRKQCDIVNKSLLECKQKFISNQVIENQKDVKKLFKITKHLLGDVRKPSLPKSENHKLLANKFNNFFLDKIISIRDGIQNAATPSNLLHFEEKLFPGHSSSKLSHFTPASENEIRKFIIKASDSSCELDPIPTCILKKNLDIFVPVVTKLVNSSLETGIFPDNFKKANIIPLLKKEGLDPESFKNYRPVSNLSFMSKIVEQVVAARLKNHLDTNSLWEKNQSAYRAFHSTETALLRVYNDTIKSIDQKKVVALILLDLSAAFDTINHKILLKRLSSKYGVSSVALKWFSSYIQNRQQKVKINRESSDELELPCGVPQGSVLGPLLFTLYVAPVANIAREHGIDNMFYADDSQLYFSFNHKEKTESHFSNFEQCLHKIKLWMQENFLKLNDDKTEFILLGSKYSVNNLPVINIKIGNNIINSCTSLRNLGAYFDNIVSMEKFVKFKSKSIHFQLKKIYRIRKYLTVDSCKTLIQSLVISRLDYCSSLLFGVNKKYINQLQRLQDTAARLICNSQRHESAAPLRKQLHWLPVEQRIQFRIATFVFKSLNNQAPAYLTELISVSHPVRSLRSNNQLLLNRPVVKTKMGERAFENCAPVIWNSLPIAIKKANTINTFKKLLKTHYFVLSYNI